MEKILSKDLSTFQGVAPRDVKTANQFVNQSYWRRGIAKTEYYNGLQAELSQKKYIDLNNHQCIDCKKYNPADPNMNCKYSLAYDLISSMAEAEIAVTKCKSYENIEATHSYEKRYMYFTKSGKIKVSDKLPKYLQNSKKTKTTNELLEQYGKLTEKADNETTNPKPGKPGRLRKIKPPRRVRK